MENAEYYLFLSYPCEVNCPKTTTANLFLLIELLSLKLSEINNAFFTDGFWERE